MVTEACDEVFFVVAYSYLSTFFKFTTKNKNL